MKEIQNKNALQIGKTSDRIAFGSAIIGTLILVLYFVPIEGLDFIMLLAGYCYLIIAIVVNVLTLIVLIVSIFYNQIYWKYFLTRIGILLLNIPIAILYFLVVMYSSNIIS